VIEPGVAVHGDPPAHLTFAALERLGLPHVSTTRHCPGIAEPDEPGSPFSPESAGLFAGWGLDLSRAAFLRQVHGAGVRRADDRSGGFVGEGDILLTETPGLPLAVFTADCLAIILFDPFGRRLAVAHVGWRGTVKGAAATAVRALLTAGSRPADLIAAIAPSIGGCCYEVDRPVIDPLRAAFSEEWQDWAREAGEGKWMLDLWAANESQLRAAGLSSDHIVNPRLCTACRPELFFSYRKEGSRGRLVTVASLPVTAEPEIGRTTHLARSR
jgi:YfiH family protein